jgi:hypothetical protein
MSANDTQQLPPAASLRAGSTPAQEVFLGTEIDQCSGSLTVKNRAGKWVAIPRGHKTVVDVAITGNGYWYWRCGSTLEKSRGEPNYRQRVKRLKVTHSTQDREIRWECFDIL